MKREKTTIGFIGCGNMGGALARASAAAGYSPMLSSLDSEQVRSLANDIGGVPSDNAEIAQQCDYIFLAVKPQMMADMLSGISTILKARSGRFVLVTMAAGLSIESIRKMAGGEYPVIRIMPNTPAGVGEGVILYCTDGVEPDETAVFCDILGKAGMIDPIPEKLIDAASALSGCAPAFVFQFIESLADGAVDCGLPRDKAQRYAVQTVLGSAKLAASSGKHPYELRDAVCSPGGSTIEGVRALADGGFDSAVMQAVISAYKRTLELGR